MTLRTSNPQRHLPSLRMFTEIKEIYGKENEFQFQGQSCFGEQNVPFPEVFTTAIVFPSSLGDGPAGHYG